MPRSGQRGPLSREQMLQRSSVQVMSGIGQILDRLIVRGPTAEETDQLPDLVETQLLTQLGTFLAQTGDFMQRLAAVRGGRPIMPALPLESPSAVPLVNGPPLAKEQPPGAPQAAPTTRKPRPPTEVVSPAPPLGLPNESVLSPVRPPLGAVNGAGAGTLRVAILEREGAAPAAVGAVPALFPVPRPFPVRELEEIRTDQLEAAVQLSSIDPTSGEYDLIRFKRVVCRCRRAYMECQRGHFMMLPEVDGLWRELNQIATEQIKTRYVEILRPHLQMAVPQQWEELRTLYQDLGNALEAVQWYQIHRPDLRGLEGKDLLEGAMATQELFYRWTTTIWTREVLDEQQRLLFRWIREICAEQDIHLRVLQDKGRLSDADLKKIADDTSSQYFAIRSRVEGRRVQAESIQRVLGMIEIASFGSGPRKTKDAQEVRDALAYALDMGMPPSTKLVRDALIPYVSYLEDDPRLERVVAEIRKEVERRSAAPEELNELDTLDKALSRQFEDVKRLTKGKKVLILGGEPMPEQIAKLGRFEFSDINWPAGATSKPTVAFKGSVEKADLVLLMIRCMGHSLSNSQFLKKIGTPFVRVQGFGFARIVLDLHAQLVPAGGR